ncbi:hypothetical protein MMC19_003336 [Ptychographa xylographoides]|nr:hypothetical protein [Ptychographa xylographoides]
MQTISETDLSAQTFAAVVDLRTENENLQTKLRYMESAMNEVQSINKELHGMLDRIQSRIWEGMNANLGTAIGRPSSKGNWVGGAWLALPENEHFLGQTERLLNRGAKEEALIAIKAVLGRDNLSPAQRVDAGLLFSTILRSTEDQAGALRNAEEALRIAGKNDLLSLVGKARFHQGLCFLYLERYADASWCFHLASHTDGHAEQVQVHRELAEAKRLEMHPTDPQRFISKDFLL